LENAVLSKVAATPYLFSRSFRSPNLGAAAMLVAPLSGSCRVEQHNRSCTLHPGEWCVFDPFHPFKLWSFAAYSEYLVLTLERPLDRERLGLLEQALGRGWDAKAGMSRVLLTMLTETFNQMNRLDGSSKKSLEHALTEMAWGAVREQFVAPPPGVHRDVLRTHIKTYIEQHLVPGLDRARAPDVRTQRPSRIRSRSSRFNFELHLDAPAQSLRGKPAGPEASASIDHRHRFFLGLQQHLSFQSPLQGAVRGPSERVQDSIRKCCGH
jgi:hypothetical protein